MKLHFNLEACRPMLMDMPSIIRLIN